MQNSLMPPYTGTEKYIFISFSQHDEERMLPIIERMVQDGFRVWFGSEASGKVQPETVAARLNGAEVCIAFLSSHTLADENSRKEISYALLKRKYFISVLLEPVRLTPGMESQLASYKCIAAYGTADIEACLRDLYAVPKLNACRNSAAPSAETVAAPLAAPEEEAPQTDASFAETDAAPAKPAPSEAPKRMLSDYQLVRLTTGEIADITLGIFLLGRAEDRVDYAIPDVPSIGRIHARIVANPAGCSITDNDSLNKTSVNGTVLEPNKPFPLLDGDIICLSSEQFLFRRAQR